MGKGCSMPITASAVPATASLIVAPVESQQGCKCLPSSKAWRKRCCPRSDARIRIKGGRVLGGDGDAAKELAGRAGAGRQANLATGRDRGLRVGCSLVTEVSISVLPPEVHGRGRLTRSPNGSHGLVAREVVVSPRDRRWKTLDRVPGNNGPRLLAREVVSGMASPLRFSLAHPGLEPRRRARVRPSTVRGYGVLRGAVSV